MHWTFLDSRPFFVLFCCCWTLERSALRAAICRANNTCVCGTPSHLAACMRTTHSCVCIYTTGCVCLYWQRKQLAWPAISSDWTVSRKTNRKPGNRMSFCWFAIRMRVFLVHKTYILWKRTLNSYQHNNTSYYQSRILLSLTSSLS